MKIGDQAPRFSLPDQDGKTYDLSEHLGAGPIVVFFYPKDDSAVCTAEVCAFRDSYETFLKLGAQVVGISSDSEESHSSFAGKHRLPFPLLSDTNGTVRKEFGVPKTFGIIPGRATYVLDKTGALRDIFSDMLHAERHLEEALRVVQSLS